MLEDVDCKGHAPKVRSNTPTRAHWTCVPKILPTPADAAIASGANRERHRRRERCLEWPRRRRLGEAMTFMVHTASLKKVRTTPRSFVVNAPGSLSRDDVSRISDLASADT